MINNLLMVYRWRAFPVVALAIVGLLVWLWPIRADTMNLVPPVVDAGPSQIITDLAQGQPVGDEEYWGRFRLNKGWYLAPAADDGHYNLVAAVTNITDTPDLAKILVRIRVADRYTELLMCSVTLTAYETRMLTCADTAHAQYSSRWSRIILESW